MWAWMTILLFVRPWHLNWHQILTYHLCFFTSSWTPVFWVLLRCFRLFDVIKWKAEFSYDFKCKGEARYVSVMKTVSQAQRSLRRWVNEISSRSWSLVCSTPGCKVWMDRGMCGREWWSKRGWKHPQWVASLFSKGHKKALNKCGICNSFFFFFKFCKAKLFAMREHRILFLLFKVN